jgi:hypothetical protein
VSSRAQSERSEQPPEVDSLEQPAAALLGAARSPGTALLALQRTAGNRAVQRLVSAAAIARKPGRDTSVSPIAAELEARAKVERDTLGLGEGQEGIFYAMSFVVGEKDVVLADYLATGDGSGKVEIKPWSERYGPALPPQRDAAGNTFEL